MAAVASIIIEVDEKGAVSALNRVDTAGRQIEPGLQRVGQRGNVVMTGLAKDHQRARDAAQLLSNMIGIQMPRSIERVIVSSAGMQKALLAAFSVTSVVGVAVFAIQQIVDTIDRANEAFDNFTKTAQRRQAAADAIGREIFHKTLKDIRDTQIETQRATAGAIEQIHIQLRDTLRDIDDQIQSQEALGNKRTVEELRNLRTSEEKKASAEILAIRRKLQEETLQFVAQQNQASLTGLDLINAQEDEAIRRLADAFGRGEVLAGDFETRLTAVQDAAQAQRIKLSRDAANEGAQAILQAEAQGAAGIDQINKEVILKVQQTNQKELELHIELSDQRKALTIETTNRIREIERQRLNELQDLESETAVAILPPWERANAEITASAKRRVREIEQLMERDKSFQEQGAREIALIWQQTFAQMRDTLAEQLEGLFDDITSGNIGRRFLNQFKKLVFEMIASWLLGLRQMQGASSGAFGGGGLLSSIFGGLLGIKVPGIGPGGTAPFSPAGGGGIGGIFGGLLGLGGLFGSSSAAATGSASAGLAGLPIGLTGSQLGNLGLTALPLSAGGGLGGSVLPAGSGPTSGLGALLQGLGPSQLALGIAGIPLLLAGIGQGGFTGGLSGALGGAGIGTAILPGTGTVIGAIVGFFAGLFGGGKRQRAVEQLGKEIKDQIQKVEEAYNTHQIEFDPAIGNLESLRADAQQKMHKLGGDTRRRVQEPINQAEDRIRKTEAERTRRLALIFGPAQFREGGFVGADAAAAIPASFATNALRFATGGEVPAILHAGEFVMRPEAVRQHGVETLERMNSGVGGEVHIHMNIQAWDARGVADWLRNGGSKLLWQAAHRDRNEGRL